MVLQSFTVLNYRVSAIDVLKEPVFFLKTLMISPIKALHCFRPLFLLSLRMGTTGGSRSTPRIPGPRVSLCLLPALFSHETEIRCTSQRVAASWLFVCSLRLALLAPGGYERYVSSDVSHSRVHQRSAFALLCR